MYLNYSEFEDRSRFESKARQTLEEEGEVYLESPENPVVSQSVGFSIVNDYRREDVENQVRSLIRHPVSAILDPKDSVGYSETEEGILVFLRE